ncbi:hypothetical protein GE061_003733 [Apolygus lucorum]|uniref:Uncharacterized protein n=1 Tax=Apolygus lucorum TaxID=248454 RepID=A0A8S9X6X0_APOLU|nr:hypothetical protein GE061_003733 [Apolygus lucorum]
MEVNDRSMKNEEESANKRDYVKCVNGKPYITEKQVKNEEVIAKKPCVRLCSNKGEKQVEGEEEEKHHIVKVRLEKGNQTADRKNAVKQEEETGKCAGEIRTEAPMQTALLRPNDHVPPKKVPSNTPESMEACENLDLRGFPRFEDTIYGKQLEEKDPAMFLWYVNMTSRLDMGT